MCKYRVITNGWKWRAQFKPSGWFQRWRDIGSYGETDVKPLYDSLAIARAVISEDSAASATASGQWEVVRPAVGG